MSRWHSIIFRGETQLLYVLPVLRITIELLLVVVVACVIVDGRVSVLVENVVSVIQTQTCLPALLLIFVSCRLRKHKISIPIKLLFHLLLTMKLVVLLVSSNVLIMYVAVRLCRCELRDIGLSQRCRSSFQVIEWW